MSILKPVRGLDPYQYENFASFCKQDYGEYEILFAVADALDPSIPVIRRLQANYPERRIVLLIVPVVAANQKVGLLDELCQVARHDLLVISDSDMRVSPNYLRKVVRPLSEVETGLVTCSYRGIHVESIPSCLGALHMGVMFLPSVIVARKFLDMQFAMGATIALRRQDLDQMGGFSTISDCLADDFQLAVRIIEGGKKVILSEYIVSSVLGAQSLREQWRRELRWARTNRSNRPFEYPGLAPLYTITWASLYLLASDFSLFGWQVFWVTLMFRWLTAWLITWQTDDRESRHHLIWLPIRDLMSSVIWILSCFSNQVTWRGQEYRIFPGGRMEPCMDNPGRLERIYRRIPWRS